MLRRQNKEARESTGLQEAQGDRGVARDRKRVFPSTVERRMQLRMGVGANSFMAESRKLRKFPPIGFYFLAPK